MELNFLTDNAIIYVLIAWVAIFAVAKGLRLEKYGFSIKPYSLTYKNYKVQDALVRLLGRTRRGVRIFADVSVIAGFIMMGYVFFFLFLNISNYFVEPDEFAELTVLLPGVTMTSASAIMYFLLSIPIVLVIHEGAHGIVGVLEKINIKTGGAADLRGGGSFSARLTAGLVAAASISRNILPDEWKIEATVGALGGLEGEDGIALAEQARKEGDSVAFHLGMNATSEQIPLIFSARPALLGKHNVANALVAAAMAWHAGVSGDVIQRVVAQFGGVRRRMEVHLDHPTAVYVDDYAHHPTELQALLDAVRERWPKREITLVFQPHLYSRTRDFGLAFAEVLGQADRLFLLPIYPAREAPIPGVDAQWLFDNISGVHKQLTTSDSIFGDLKARSVDVLVTAGAGDIDRLVPQALQHMRARLE